MVSLVGKPLHSGRPEFDSLKPGGLTTQRTLNDRTTSATFLLPTDCGSDDHVEVTGEGVARKIRLQNELGHFAQNWAFLRFINFKGRKYSFPPPSPPCNVVPLF